MALCLDPPNTTFKERKAVWTKQTGRQVRLPKGGCESQKGQYGAFLQSSSDRDPRPRYQGEAGGLADTGVSQQMGGQLRSGRGSQMPILTLVLFCLINTAQTGIA